MASVSYPDIPLTVTVARADAYYTHPLGTKCEFSILLFLRVLAMAQSLTQTEDWDSPYTFFQNVYQVKDENGNFQRNITGSIGTFLGVW